MTDGQGRDLPPARGKSLADIAAALEQPAGAGALSTAAWVKIAVLAVLFRLVNGWQLPLLHRRYRVDANWTHGYIIPLFSLYLLYARRQEILSAPRRRSFLGLAIFLLGLAISALGVPFLRNQWASHAGMVVSLLGLVAYLAGWKVMRVAWLPVAYLILAMPLPPAVYDGIALPLQNLAAAASAKLLGFFGVVISVLELNLTVTSLSGQVKTVTVAEACSGIRSMMAFVALAVAWAYITPRPWWHRLTLVLAGIPVMVACNILRVSLTCTMFVIDKPQFGEDLMHEFMGMALLVPAMGLLWLLSKFLSALFVDVEEEDSPPAGDGPEPQAGQERK